MTLRSFFGNKEIDTYRIKKTTALTWIKGEKNLCGLQVRSTSAST